MAKPGGSPTHGATRGSTNGSSKQRVAEVVKEVSPTPETERSNPLSALQQEASRSTMTVSSTPTSVASSTIVVRKRSSQGHRQSSALRSVYGQKTTTVNFVKEQYAFIRGRCFRELGVGVGSHVFDTSYAGLLEWIRAERITRLPHKDGSWDRVLLAAQHFADQVDRLTRAIAAFTPECHAASNLVFGQCLLLLELGHENASALEAAFALFYRLGLELTPLLRAEDILALAPPIMEQVGRAFSELLGIVTGVAFTFYSAVHNGKHSTRLDIYSTFGALIDNFRLSVSRCAHEMWNFVLISRGFDDGCQVAVLQKWLAPQDKTLAFLASNHINLANRPEEFTCTWFQAHLSSFFKGTDDVLVVEGGSGTGKTTLANWTVDRLQRRIGGRMMSTLSFFFNSSIMAQATVLGMLKTLLHQLVAQRIGDLDLFNVVNNAFTMSSSLSTSEKQENMMWDVLESALASVNEGYGDTLAIIVDGVDEIDGLKPEAQRIVKKLHELAHRLTHVRLIQFSQTLKAEGGASVHKVPLGTENTYDDIQTIIRQGLGHHAHFLDREVDEQEYIIDQLSNASEGSMLRVALDVQYLKLQTTHGAFNQAIETLLKSPRTVSDSVQRLLPAMQLESDSKSLLSWLIAAERPLSLQEVGLLLQAQPETSRMTDKIALLSNITKSVEAFVVTGEGLIAIRHNAIKQALVSIPSTSKKLSLNLKERHRDLLMRLFICVKKHLQTEHEPSLEFLDQNKLETRIASHHLLEYTLRYWTIHFRKSSLFKVNGDLSLPEEFCTVFPGSVGFVLLEAACWKSQSFPHEAMELFTVAFRVRKALFGLENTSVLQSTIICAIFCETVLSDRKEAVEWYARAIRIGRVVLGIQAELVISCCTTLLRISEAFVTEKRTEIMTYREEVFLVLISSYKHRYGESSKEVLEIYQRLAELYTFICEEEKATEIYIKIKEVTITVHGGRSSEFDSVSRHLDVVLRKHDHNHEVDVFDGFLFGYEEETEEVLTIIRVDAMIRIALDFITRTEFTRAEEIYVELWLKLTEHCRTIGICEWHEKKIEVMLKYVAFLRDQKRVEEASAVLLCCWHEYSSHQVSTFESIIILLKEVAVCMKVVGMAAIALTVFQKCWSWFKSSHKEDTVIFKEIEEHITVTSKEIVKKSTTTTVTTSETVIREVFESSFSETEISSTTVELCESLTLIYIEQERWTEAISVIKSTLRKSWVVFFAESVEDVTMASHFSSESIELVMKLAHCYISQKRYEKAEYLYLRLYRVHRRHFSVDNALVIKYCETYLAFLKKHDMIAQVISFYQELLVEYRSFYGLVHSMTINVLYSLGDICRHHYLTHGYWIEYYLEIVVNLNKGALICHEDAFRALVIVTEHYYETLRYSESIVYFKSIIATFCKFGTKFKYFEDITIVQKLLEKYYRATEETKVEIHVHVAILKEIREACFKYFGESSSISVNLTVVLAEVCCRSEKYEFEALSYYEHILKHSTSVSTTVIKRSQSTLKSLYVKQITSSTTMVTKEVIERATTMTYERYIEIRKTHSCTHEATLTHLKELVMLYHKQSKLELVTTELRSLIVDCMTKVTSSKELTETAKFIAAIYISCGYLSHGLDLIRELKLQVIYKSVSKSCGFSVTTVGHVCFAFIAAFEYHLRADFTLTIAAFLAELMAEFLFYERFSSSIKTKASIEVVLVHAARLRHVLVRTRRIEDFEIIERQALEYFMIKEKSVVKSSSKSAIKMFVDVLLTYVSERGRVDNFVASSGHAAVHELKRLLEAHKYKEVLELSNCTFRFLMAHGGLDDPTEIRLGFQLCLMMAGRGEYKHQSKDATIHKLMLELSRQILGEVFDICKKSKINLARCPVPELNELIAMVGEQNDQVRLQWLLSNLWNTRGGQSSWGEDVVLELGKRLVQAQFLARNRTIAIRLAEDLVYNVRRVHGARHKQTLSIYALLATLYTSTAQHYQGQTKDESAPPLDRKRAADLARVYFKKAINVHEDVLKLLVEVDAQGSDDDDDFDSELGSARGAISQDNSKPGCGHAYLASRNEEVDAVRRHLRLLKLAAQRFGGWSKPATEYERLTAKVFASFGPELKLNEDEILAKKWKVSAYGGGKAEAEGEDGFAAPEIWTIC